MYNPRRDRWDEHFAWSDTFLLIVGLTPAGRATVELLLLNRDGVINLRRRLYSIGKTPATSYGIGPVRFHVTRRTEGLTTHPI